jgi:hypothetical protein
MTAQTLAQALKDYRPDDPSYWRRKALLCELEGSSDGIGVSSFFPILRYYETADKVLAAFMEAIAENDLDASFVYGKRFCIFCLDSLPKHNYYSSKKYDKERRKYTKDAETVIGYLEKVKAEMDVEERAKHEKHLEYARQEAARVEAERKRQEAIHQQQEKARYEELMRRASQQRKGNATAISPSKNGVNVSQSAMNKLQMLTKQTSATNMAPSSTEAPAPKRPSGRYFLGDSEEDEEEDANLNPSMIDVGQPLPPPMPPPSYGNIIGAQSSLHSKSNGSLPPALSPPVAAETPPPYEYAVNTQRRNPFLGPSNGIPYALPPPLQPWGEVRPSSFANSSSSNSHLPDPPTKFHHPTQKPGQPQKRIPVRQLRDRALQRYQELQRNGQIEVRPIETYQSRVTGSVNGCAVISPLMVAHHLATSNGVVLPNHEIVQVIDKECVPLSREIRRNLDIGEGGLIIPSDVHDHLTDKKILFQKHFVGATGGSVLSEQHMGEFLKLFQAKRKAGATFFFKEHVISILKIPVGGGKAFYDVVDSLPGTTDSRSKPCASRTRCKDEEALDVLLKWYTTKKLDTSKFHYIDNNDWDENNPELDPRVFQGFVWGIDD